MQFHHRGYVSANPRIQHASPKTLPLDGALPEEVDVLIVGAGPAGMLTAAQLSQYPDISTAIVDRRSGRLEIGQADGLQARTLEILQSFGFADEIIAEGFRLLEVNFWEPDPDHPQHIHRAGHSSMCVERPHDDPTGLSEFPHLVVNQARVLDYLAAVMRRSSRRLQPHYGYEFAGLEKTDGCHPILVRLRATGETAQQERVIRAKYLVGSDGARSAVRSSIGRQFVGAQANHAWGVVDLLATSDFPDLRKKCTIQSHDGGSLMLIPREGGYMFRLYVDLGPVDSNSTGEIRTLGVDKVLDRARKILAPYSLEVKEIVWSSIYEVGHRITDRFDDLSPGDAASQSPRVFIAGDACHTHSAKAGQGMNVSMQDGFNLAWKIASVLEGDCHERILNTYSAERREVAQDLIDFDRKWSSLLATPPEELPDPCALTQFYEATREFPAGFKTEYKRSLLTGSGAYQGLATGFPLGKRFRSAPVIRVADANPVELGHEALADGRWRLYAFAGEDPAGSPSPLTDWAEWLIGDSHSPMRQYTKSGSDQDATFDVKVIYQQDHHDIDINLVPKAFRPSRSPHGLVDYSSVYSVQPNQSIFELRGIDRTSGCVVVVRPDQHVSAVLPYFAKHELSDLFSRFMIPQHLGSRSQPALVR